MRNDESNYFLNKQLIKVVERENFTKKDLSYIWKINRYTHKRWISTLQKYYKKKLNFIIN